MNKKIKILLAVVLFAMILLFTTNVNAGSMNQLKGYFDVTQEGDVTVYKLKENAALDIIVGIEDDPYNGSPLTPKPENVVIDLAGHKLTNYTTGCEVIQVYNGSTLTIKDSSERKTGEITQKSGTTQVLIRNNGTLNIEGGKFSTIGENSQGGVIENSGNLTINGGDFKLEATNSKISTINNNTNGTVTINGGTFSTKSDHSVISNAGKLTLKGGEVSTEFTNPTNWLVDNMGDLTVTGDTKITKGASTSAAIGNLPKYSNAKITVSGGKLESESDLIRNYEGNVEISGGELTTTGSGNVVVNSSGNLTITGGTLTAQKADNAVYVGSNSTVSILGGKIEAPKGSVYVEDPETTEIEVAKNVGTLETKEVEGYGVFTTKDGKEITGKYEDITFKVKVDEKEVSSIELIEGSKATLNLTAVLGDSQIELADSVLAEVEDTQFATYTDGELTALKVGETKLVLKLGEVSSNINIIVVASATEQPNQPEQTEQPEEQEQPDDPNQQEEQEQPEESDQQEEQDQPEEDQPEEEQQEEQEQPDEKNNDDNVNTPSTGDYIIPVAIILVFVVAANVIYFIRKKQK